VKVQSFMDAIPGTSSRRTASISDHDLSGNAFFAAKKFLGCLVLLVEIGGGVGRHPRRRSSATMASQPPWLVIYQYKTG